MSVCGIYKITQKSSNLIYIGQSVDCFYRWSQHLNYGKQLIEADANSRDWHSFLYKMPQDFSFEIIELCDRENLDERERYWIGFYNSFFNGLNKTPGNKVVSKELPYEWVATFDFLRSSYITKTNKDEIIKILSSKKFVEAMGIYCENHMLLKKYKKWNTDIIDIFYTEPKHEDDLIKLAGILFKFTGVPSAPLIESKEIFIYVALTSISEPNTGSYFVAYKGENPCEYWTETCGFNKIIAGSNTKKVDVLFKYLNDYIWERKGSNNNKKYYFLLDYYYSCVEYNP